MDVQRDIGALEPRMNAVEVRLEKIETKLDQLVEFMANAKGGWVKLVAVGSIAATIALPSQNSSNGKCHDSRSIAPSDAVLSRPPR
jgi:hypothetical protein